MRPTIINLTPHDVTVVADDGSEQMVTFERSGTIARAVEHHTLGHSLVDDASIGTMLVRYDGVVDLPDPQDGVAYIVSVLTAMAAHVSARGSADLYYPGNLIRDIGGRVIGCSALYQIAT